MLENLPLDVLIGILTRLPVESIVRCSLACKSWYSLITNPSFISQHLKLNQKIAKQNPKFLVRRLDMCSLHSDNEKFDNESANKPDFYFNFKYTCPNFRIVGSINGVLCLSGDEWDHRNKIMLWNPMIDKSVTLPKYEMDSSFFNHLTGFGFDPLTNDYTVIQIGTCKYSGYTFQTPDVVLYTLSTRAWQNISGRALPYGLPYKSRQAYLNGAIHWVAHWKLDICTFLNLIVLFDLHDDMFREMKLPEVVAHSKCEGLLYVVVVQESLSVINYRSNTPIHNLCYIWILEEYGREDSWTRRYTVNVPVYFHRPLYFNRNGEMVLTTNSGGLVSCDLELGEFKNYGRYAESENLTYQIFYVGSLTESLVLLDQSAITDEDVNPKTERKTFVPLLRAFAALCKSKKQREESSVWQRYCGCKWRPSGKGKK